MMPLEGPALSKKQVLQIIRSEVKTALDALIANTVPIEKFLVTKSLRKTYKNENLPHVVLQKKIIQRIAGGQVLTDPPRAGDRISYVIIETKKRNDKLCNKSEDLDWVKAHKKLKIDREYYVSNQIMKPFDQIVAPFGSLNDLWDQALAELKRQRLKIKALTTYFQPIDDSIQTTPAIQIPKLRLETVAVKKKIDTKPKKKKKTVRQRSLFEF
jgi:DNA polymerase elongation subunit (family B)